jgi:histidinol-phosphate aminotransferase
MNIKSLIRPNILNLKPYTSARDIYGGEGILLDANENSFGSTVNGIELRSGQVELNRYPDPNQKDLREIVGKYYSLPYENLFFGVGSDEIIDLLIRIFCEPGKDSVLIPEPTYGMYKVACDINNVYAKEILLNDDFQVNLSEVQNNFTKITKIIFLCSPNNPTGNLLNKNDILNLCKNYNSIIIVDEAYIDFTGNSQFINEIENHPNLILLRTFSKAWGLAGIRLGFCFADPEIIKMLFKVKAPYNINALTRYAVESAIKNSQKKDEFVKLIIYERERLKQQLENSGKVIKVFESEANFLLFKCDNAKEVQKKLAEQGVIVRDRSTQPKLEGCLRVSVGTEEQNDLFIKALKNIVETPR